MSVTYAVREADAVECEAVAKLKLLLSENWVLPPKDTVESDDSSSSEPIPFYQFTDTAFLRFYRGRKGDITNAHTALCRTTRWRHENKIDDITEEDIKVEIEKNKLIIKGVDLHGRPCVNIIVRNHKSDDRDITVISKFINYNLEKILKTTIPSDEKMTIIFDLHEFSFASMDYEVVKILIGILQYNYPETLSVLGIINSPFIFSACWAIIRMWLDPDTRAKVLFLSADELPKYVDVASLPSELHI